MLRPVIRRLFRTPAFAVTAIVTLAIGIGANVAMFAVVDGVLINALPYPAPDSLVAVRHSAPGISGVKDVMTSPTMYFTYSDENPAAWS